MTKDPSRKQAIRTIVVDDEPLARRRVRSLLRAHAEFEVLGECEDGPQAIAAIREHQPDLVFLDIKMVELDGLDVARAVSGPGAPVIVFVSAYDQYALDAFGVCALDYLLKPFDEERFVETLDRVRERVAQARTHPVHQQYRAGDIEVDVTARTVHRGKRAIVLRPKEFDLLIAFLKRPGVVISKRELLNEVWGYQADVMSRTIDTHLAELRRKLSPAARDGECIETIARVGYRFVAGA